MPPRKATSGALERAGLGSGLSRAGMEALGFYVCTADQEDELIRALGAASVEEIIQAHGDSRSFSIFQRQPAQQGRSPERQLRRFMGTRSGRKSHYARLLVSALDLTRVPQPLDGVLRMSEEPDARLLLCWPGQSWPALRATNSASPARRKPHRYYSSVTS